MRESVCLWRVSSENSLVELDFLKALSLQRWIECKICEALWKIAGEKEERVKERVVGWVGSGGMGGPGRGGGLVEGMSFHITKSFRVAGNKDML